MTTIDLNADLGESFGPWRMGDDAAMMDIVTSANVACGGHAGDANTMVETLSIAVDKGVCVGAHPGFNDKEGFGRRRLPLSLKAIEQLVAAQVGTLRGVSGLANAQVRYVKAHGALGNMGAEDAAIAGAITSAIKRASPDLAILAISGTELEKAALKLGLETYSEIFADRGYGDDGNLVPRAEPGAMIDDPAIACARLVRFFDSGKMPTVSGGEVSLKAESICIHGDSPHSVMMAKAVRQMLLDSGMTLKSFVDVA